jgi:NAD+ kinase
MKFPFKTIALVGKYKTPEIASSLLHLADFLAARGLEVLIDILTAEHIKQQHYRTMSLNEMDAEPDLVIVLGGDGTLLNIACILAPHGIPLVGVNQGRLGFLTDISLDTMLQTISAMLEGKFVTEQRLLLKASVLREGVEVFSSRAFNEVVIHRDNANCMIEFDVTIDEEYVYNQYADGLIVATPTGSTAYALSSGGSILHPGMDIIELVPVCPHTLSNRPIVVKGDSRIEIDIRVNRTSFVRVRLDSHSYFDLKANDRVVVTRYENPAILLHPVGHSYYHTLREKLHWNKQFD